MEQHRCGSSLVLGLAVLLVATIQVIHFEFRFLRGKMQQAAGKSGPTR